MMPFQDTVLLLTQEGMGHGPKDLQLTLLNKYLALMEQNDQLPSAICLYTEGVKLVTDPSPILEQFKQLEAKGVRVIACSTCLNYFGIMDQLKAGIAGSMADILEAQMRASKVITL